MRDIKWLMNRLQAMNLHEILWRMQQKKIQYNERKHFSGTSIPVTKVPLQNNLTLLQPHIEVIGINWVNVDHTRFTELSIFDVFPYSEYKKKWNDGFQTENHWPENDFSYDINCNQRVDIGDIRTNWELNRHYQFAALAKSYYSTGDKDCLIELEDLFSDWNQSNAFLHGGEWTSPMEIAIRVNSWIFTYCFLAKAFQHDQADKRQNLMDSLNHGILVMTNHITKHYSRYSSANNHLIVEMYAVGMAGIFYQYQPWIDLAVKILTDELPRQNCADGVNREMSLHYQSFIMEAYGLLIHAMCKNGIKIPEVWSHYLSKMSEFLADCCGDYGETVVFGDNDEGKILDLVGVKFDHYRYVLDLMGCVLVKRYSSMDSVHENIKWLEPGNILEQCRAKELYQPPLAHCYKEGGYTILRSRDHKILIGIDHADLGFGSIAAHGHADALSFQMFVKGVPVFLDPGTYNYHITPEDRDYFRRTENHNTVTVNGQNQSEMLGPFLWGKKAKCSLLKFKTTEDCVTVMAVVSYNQVHHNRTYKFDYYNTLLMEDSLESNLGVEDIKQTFLLGPQLINVTVNSNKCTANLENNEIQLTMETNQNTTVDAFEYSPAYAKKIKSARVVVEGNIKEISLICKIVVGSTGKLGRKSES